MANKRISELTAVSSPSLTDILPIVNAGATKKITLTDLFAAATLSAAQLTSGTVPLARLVGLTNAQLDAAAAIDWTKINKAGSSLADLITRSAADLTSGLLPDARLSSNVPLKPNAETVAGVWAFTNGLKERGRTAKIGAFTDVAFDAANFTANGSMTWTVGAGDQIAYARSLVGDTMTLSFYIQTTSVGGTLNNALRIAIPDGLASTNQFIAPVFILPNTAVSTVTDVGLVFGTPAATYIEIYRAGNINWVATTDTTGVFGTFAFKVN